MDQENITLDNVNFKTYSESSVFSNISKTSLTSLKFFSEAYSTSREFSVGQTIFIVIMKTISIFYYFEKAFYLPLCIIFGTINNLFILIVFLRSREIYNKISRTALVYYVSLAIGDLGCIYFIPFLFFLGKNF